jgi:hypothetical protein
MSCNRSSSTKPLLGATVMNYTIEKVRRKEGLTEAVDGRTGWTDKENNWEGYSRKVRKGDTGDRRSGDRDYRTTDLLATKQFMFIIPNSSRDMSVLVP